MIRTPRAPERRESVLNLDLNLDLLASRYRQLRRVTASLGAVGEDTAREHVRWLLRPRGEQEEPCER